MGAEYPWIGRHSVRNECSTPSTIYGTKIAPDRIQLTIDFPVELPLQGDDKALVAEFHAAVLPVVESLFKRHWDVFAGKKIRDYEVGLTKQLPETWEELDPQRHNLSTN